MGGNAIKNAKTRRYDANEYHALEHQVLTQLRTDFPNRRIEAIKAYRSKPSFGDMDVLFETADDNTDWREYISRTFSSKEIVPNGNVISFEHLEFQIDLIRVPGIEFDTSASYFAWNDLGNLCGRLSQSMGLKLGHDGLTYSWKHDTYKFAEMTLLTDWCDILPILDLNYDTWKNGFDTVEDIYKFVTSSKFFNADMFLLQNRNHTSRVRDAKRKTYTDFLVWIQDPNKSLPSFPYKENKKDWLPYLFEQIPHFEQQYNEIQKRYEQASLVKAKLNGKIVMDITTLRGNELGNFMTTIKESFNDIDQFHNWVMSSSESDIKQYIIQLYEQSK